MDENHQDKTESRTIATEGKLLPPPLSTKDYRGADRAQNKRVGAIIKRSGFFGYDKETKVYAPNGQLTKITKEHQPGKTLWDWLQLVSVLLIPLVIFLATMRFNQQQTDLAQQQHANDQKIANQQRNADQQRSLDQQQAAILQTYIDNMQDLLLNHNLLKSKPDGAIAILARARTLTALRGLDTERKGLLVQFLYEAKLIGFLDNNSIYGPIIDLSNADLTSVDLSNIDLTAIDLSNTHILFANLTGDDLSTANLSGADLSGSNLDIANLSGANLSNTSFIGADLSGANLSDAQNLTQQQLDQVYSCKNAILPPGLTCNRNL